MVKILLLLFNQVVVIVVAVIYFGNQGIVVIIDKVFDFPSLCIIFKSNTTAVFLLNLIPDRILELTEHGLAEYRGKFDYYLEKSGKMTEGDEKKARPAGDGPADELRQTQELIRSSEAERKAKKQREAEDRKKARRSESIEERIHELEGMIADIQDQMEDPEKASDPAWMSENASLMAAHEEEISSLYDEWMELQE